jgi:hypothetical protein
VRHVFAFVPLKDAAKMWNVQILDYGNKKGRISAPSKLHTLRNKTKKPTIPLYPPKISHFANKIKNTHFTNCNSHARIFANRMTAFLFGCRPDAVTGLIFGAGFGFFFLRFNAVSKSDSEVW